MLKKLKTNSRGFTIIEVMIVLAVAALIILIVLLAVPALQRSSRNTTLKSDASSVAAAITSYETNNGGALPQYVQNVTPASPDGTVIIAKTGASDTNAAQIDIQKTTTVWPLIASNGTAPTVAAPGAAGAAGSLGAGQIQAFAGHKCPADLTVANPVFPPNTRSVAVLYATENGSKFQLQCIEA